MRVLWTFNLLQTGCLIVLIFMVHGIGGQNDGPSVENPQASVSDGDIGSRTEQIQENNATSPGRSDDRLRRIIREELTAVTAHWPSADGSQEDNGQAPAKQDTDSVRRSDPEQLSAVSETIDYYQRTETISRAQMDSLLADIARLDAADRRAMLSKLMRSMDSGNIDGRM